MKTDISACYILLSWYGRVSLYAVSGALFDTLFVALTRRGGTETQAG
jgi:hypothetical protein